MQLKCPVKGRVSTAQDDDVLAGKFLSLSDLVVDVPAIKIHSTGCTQLTRLKCTETCGNDHGSGIKLGAGRGCQRKTTIIFAFQFGNGLAKMKLWVKRFDLLHQPVYEFLCSNHREGRDIVNWFLRIQFAALTTNAGQ